MTAAERQLDLPLQTEEQTKQNVVSFFKKGGEVVEGGKEGELEPQGDGAPTSEDLDRHADQEAAAEATAPPPQPPPDFQGSLEEYEAYLTAQTTAPTSQRRPRKKAVDKTEPLTVQ